LIGEVILKVRKAAPKLSLFRLFTSFLLATTVAVETSKKVAKTVLTIGFFKNFFNSVIE